MRVRGAISTYEHSYQVTSVCFSLNADQIITGGLDNLIRVWDIRKDVSCIVCVQKLFIYLPEIAKSTFRFFNPPGQT